MSHDESLHTQFSYQFFDGQGYQHTPLMHGPFLFHITSLSYWLFGDSDFSARIPVAIFGIILVVMPYLLRSWLGRVGALFTSFIFLISPYVTYYSRYIRHDIYVIVWAMIVFIAIWYYFREQKDKYLWWFAAGTALMFVYQRGRLHLCGYIWQLPGHSLPGQGYSRLLVSIYPDYACPC